MDLDFEDFGQKDMTPLTLALRKLTPMNDDYEDLEDMSCDFELSKQDSTNSKLIFPKSTKKGLSYVEENDEFEDEEFVPMPVSLQR